MRIPSPSLFHELGRYLVIFILGMLIGALIFLYMYGQMMDKLLTENRQLTITNNKLTEDNQKLEEELTKRSNQRLVIKKIDIKIVDEGLEKKESFTELEVLERLHRDLKFLIDLPLDSVADTADSILQLVNGKQYLINQQVVRPQVEALVIYTTLTLKISIHEE